MKKVLFIIVMGGLFTTSHLKSQVVLEALDAPDAYAVPVGVTLNGGETFFASIYDNDYLPYTQPSAPATWNRPINAGGGNDQLIDYQGSITTVGINVYIPITSTGNTTLPAFNQQISIPAEYTEDGISRVVELSWEAQYVTSATKNIAATVKAIGGTLNIKKLDLNGGLGNDFKGVLLGRFTYPSTNAGTSDTTYDLRVLSGILDKNFDKQTYGQYQHRFIYLPIVGPDGRMWLNNNLGADYTNINSPYFNPVYQAGALASNGVPLANPTADQIKKDFRAYGSLFEFGRDGDGHELVRWNSVAFGDPLYAGQRVEESNRTYSKSNDPCPLGWHTPTENELNGLRNSIGAGSNMWNEKIIKLPAAGLYWDMYNAIANPTIEGYYWSSTGFPEVYNTTAAALYFNNLSSHQSLGVGYERFRGFSIRCVKD